MNRFLPVDGPVFPDLQSRDEHQEEDPDVPDEDQCIVGLESQDMRSQHHPSDDVEGYDDHLHLLEQFGNDEGYGEDHREDDDGDVIDRVFEHDDDRCQPSYL